MVKQRETYREVTKSRRTHEKGGKGWSNVITRQEMQIVRRSWKSKEKIPL